MIELRLKISRETKEILLPFTLNPIPCGLYRPPILNLGNIWGINKKFAFYLPDMLKFIETIKQPYTYK